MGSNFIRELWRTEGQRLTLLGTDSPKATFSVRLKLFMTFLTFIFILLLLCHVFNAHRSSVNMFANVSTTAIICSLGMCYRIWSLFLDTFSNFLHNHSYTNKQKIRYSMYQYRGDAIYKHGNEDSFFSKNLIKYW